MECNVGGMDRTIRVILGIVLIAVGVLYLSGLTAIIAYIIAAIALITAAIAYCPLNKLLGVNTCKLKPA